jgi:hypothetical protein
MWEISYRRNCLKVNGKQYEIPVIGNVLIILRHRTSLKNTLKHIRKRGYKYSGVNKRSLMAGTSKNGEEEVYLVGLSRLSAPKIESSGDIGSFSTLDREFTPRNTDGPPIYLGPIPNNTIPPGQAFKQITTWVRELEGQVTLPETAYCIGWVDSLPDWLEIGVHQEDVDKFDEVWDRRPDVLREIVRMRIGAW